MEVDFWHSLPGFLNFLNYGILSFGLISGGNHEIIPDSHPFIQSFLQ